MTTSMIVALLMAFAQVESSHNYQAVGDGGKAYGAYQFHKARWCEAGGRPEDWGNASRLEQDRVMVNAINRYLKTKPADVDALVWITTYHNAGHGHRTPSKYTEKIRKAMK